MATQELFLSAELSAAELRNVQRRAQDGQLNRLHPGIYTPLPKKEWAPLVARNRLRILNALYPNAVIGYKSALAGGMPVDGRIYLNYTYPRVAKLPGLDVVLVRSTGRASGDMAMQEHLFLASEPRQCLENLAPNRGDDDKSAGEEAVEQRLLQICDSRGEAALNLLRDNAREIAPKLGRERELAKLDSMIGAILGTLPGHTPVTATGRAVAQGIDKKRIDLFDRLVEALNSRQLQAALDVAPDGIARVHEAFYESYFSNFIEGTKFSIEEAAAIVLEGKPVANRPKDSKDIEGVFRQANEPAWRVQTLASGKPVLEQLRVRHLDMMKARPEVEPGQFKDKPNFAGATEFVLPKLVTGTLVEASSRLPLVSAGLPRAILAHFIVVEVHPFLDGNGRASRLVMNSELTAAGLSRIIIPTISRDDYRGALKLLTHEGEPQPLIRFLAKMQRWTASFEFGDLAALRASMERCNAFQENVHKFRLEWPNDGDPQPEEPKGPRKKNRP